MPVTTAVLNAAADGAVAILGFASLHTADPEPSGGNEVAGGGYARQAITWNAATGAVSGLNGTLSFDGPASGAATHLGLWSAVSAGTFRGSSPLTGDQAFNASGEYTVTDITVTASNA